MSVRKILCVLLGLGLVTIPFLRVARADDQDAGTNAKLEAMVKERKKKTLAVVEQNKDAIITVQLVVSLKMSFGGMPTPAREQKLSIEGTVIAPSGLTVTSNSSADPLSMMKRFAEEGMEKMEISSNIVNLKIVLNDGTEIPAKVVLKDEDLDLMFILPEKAERQFHHVKLDPIAKPELLDSALTISRLDASTGRTPVIHMGSVMAIVKKPRTYYMVFEMSVGTPLFDEGGRCFGISLHRVGGAKLSMADIGNFMAFMPIVLPAEDILEAATQIPKQEK